MSLNVYTDKSQIPKGMEYIGINDSFFDLETNLQDNPITHSILASIDKAKYNSELTFIGRSEGLGALNKTMLSTGTKTLLNIIGHKDICFDVCECGDNALSMLPLITNGNILWRYPTMCYNGDSSCDIVCNGISYKDFYEFLESVGD